VSRIIGEKDVKKRENLEKKRESLEKLYFSEASDRLASDISKNMCKLRSEATNCAGRIVEIGVRRGSSTIALLHGLSKKEDRRDTSLTSLDLVECERQNLFYESAKENGINFDFVLGDSLAVGIPDCDLLFIDSFHTYAHLSLELYLHQKSVRQLILIHDTASEWPQNGHPGMFEAVVSFLETPGIPWKLRDHTDVGHGLSVLERIRSNQRFENYLSETSERIFRSVVNSERSLYEMAKKNNRPEIWNEYLKNVQERFREMKNPGI
jgi:hypothetical protein